MPKHVVKECEHITKILADLGFGDYEPIWNRAENKKLKDLRENANILFPGDELYFPEKEQRTELGDTENKHKYRRKAAKLTLRIVVRNYSDLPLKYTDCELLLEERVPKTTDENGMIEHEIPFKLKDAKLTVPSLNVTFDLKIGCLDPINTESGQRARLNNLGYFAGYSEEDDTQFTWAIEEFQFENKIKPLSGQVDEKTRAKLKEIYGC